MTSRLTESTHDGTHDWLNEYDTSSLRSALRDLDNAYKRFFNGISNRPKYHSKKHNSMTFSVRSDRVAIYKDRVQLPSIGDISIKGNIRNNIIGYGYKEAKSDGKYSNMEYKKYMNSRIIFDGSKYYLTISIEQSEYNSPSSCYRYKYNKFWQNRQCTDVIGIDVGCKSDNWLVLSDGTIVSRPSQDKENKRIKGYQRQLARQSKSKKNVDKCTKTKCNKQNNYDWVIIIIPILFIKYITRKNFYTIQSIFY